MHVIIDDISYLELTLFAKIVVGADSAYLILA